ncbi:hypothetical protein JCM19237_2781 [Photobacterium aphoticum]|uniref:Uncharacterized protein n=1 Tax=Photobacterium aphoticum TaxID=754436 RepID=A0A090QXS9_9GAMM|nr:hypothetical protein JCM19237_2781 [Photobacterium aphoticum]
MFKDDINEHEKYALHTNAPLLGNGHYHVISSHLFYANNQVDKKENTLNLLQLDIALSSQQMLMMRRHEKDFLARQDDKYITKMMDEANAIKARLKTINDNMTMYGLASDFDYQETVSAIDAYLAQFNQLTKTVYLIHGDNQNKGAIDDLKQSTLGFERVAFVANDEQLTNQLIDLQSLLISFSKILIPHFSHR